MVAQLRLLGEVEVRVEDRVLDLGHARQRCVLGVLLLDLNRAVAVDDLVDRVWADHPPQRARETLYSYLSRLRRVLDTAPDVHIGRRSGGYLLSAEPMAVDLHRFRHLVAEARAAGSGGLALLDEALDLWRGQALAGMDTPWLNGVRRLLESERFAVELGRTDQALAQGLHSQLVGPLTAAVGAHAFDERLAGQLMLALFWSGRRGDALEVYRSIWQRLADEIGADPGPDLQRLHHQILTADGAVAAPRTPAGRAPIPQNLPMRRLAFSGRVAELARLDELADDANIVVLAGMPGSGKSTLALHWAHRLRERYPDGQLYAGLRGFDPSGAADPADALRGLLAALTGPAALPADFEAQVSLYRSLLADRRLLIVLDNARDADQVRPLLPGSSASLVVVTTRRRLTDLVVDEGATMLAVNPMSDAESHQLLHGQLGAQRLRAEPEAVARIIARCAGLPLALTVVAARALADPACSLGTLMEDMSAANAAGGVRAVFSSSYRALTPSAARLLRLLGCHPGPDFTVGAAASLAAVAAEEARTQLAELVRASLVEARSPGRYALHDLIREYAADLVTALDSAADRHRATRRVLDHYLHASAAASRLLDPQRQPIALPDPADGVTAEAPADAMRWFDRELLVLVAAVWQATHGGFDDHAWRLCWTMGEFLQRQGRWGLQESLQQTALDAAGRVGDLVGQAHAHRALGLARGHRGELDRATDHLRQALALSTRGGDVIGRALAHRGLAWSDAQRDDHHGTVEHSRQALVLYRSVGHLDGQARALNAIGDGYLFLADYQAALDHCQEALELSRRLGDRLAQALTLGSLANIHHRRGDVGRAIEHYQQAVEHCHEIGDRFHEAVFVGALGDARRTSGDVAGARRDWRVAATILEQLGHPASAARRARLAEAD